MIYDNILQIVGKTPVVRLNKIGSELPVELFGKCEFLSPGGVVVLHDCNPNSATNAYPATSLEEVEKLNLPDFTGSWCGDVWKTIVHLRSQQPG